MKFNIFFDFYKMRKTNAVTHGYLFFNNNNTNKLT